MDWMNLFGLISGLVLGLIWIATGIWCLFIVIVDSTQEFGSRLLLSLIGYSMIIFSIGMIYKILYTNELIIW
jgi:hypothetical protein